MIQSSTDFELQKALGSAASKFGLHEPEQDSYRQILPFIRRRFSHMTTDDISNAFEMWAVGEYEIRDPRAKQMDGRFIAQVLGAHQTDGRKVKGSKQSREEWAQRVEQKSTVTPVEHEQIMSEGWDFQKDLLLGERTIGWKFLSTLYHWSEQSGKLMEWSDIDIEHEIKRLEGLLTSSKVNTLERSTKWLKEAANRVPEWEKKHAAQVALTMRHEK